MSSPGLFFILVPFVLLFTVAGIREAARDEGLFGLVGFALASATAWASCIAAGWL